MAKSWCAAQKQPGYCWYFDRQLPGDNNGAWHSSDLWYWFGTLKNCWRPMEEKDTTLSEEMTDYLCSFAKTGNPNGEGRPQWQPTASKKDNVLCMGEGETRMGKPSALKMWYTMFTNKAVGE